VIKVGHTVCHLTEGRFARGRVVATRRGLGEALVMWDNGVQRTHLLANLRRVESA
jgi:hypothetical protein